MSKEYILGLDIGSSSVRTALFDHGGRMRPRSLVKVEASLVGDVPVIADTVLAIVASAIDNVLEKSSGSKGEITHIASCAFWHSLVGVDSRGQPTTQVFTWADRRSHEYTAKLRAKLDEREVHSRTGARFHSSFWPAKLLWLKGRNQSDSEGDPSKTSKWLSLSDYLQLRLCDNDSTSISMASATGLFDQRKLNWDDKLVRYLGIRKSQLPQIARGSFEILPRFKKRWPRLKDARWLSSIGDGAANNFGCGCITKDRAALMIGTSGAMRIAYEGAPPNKLPSGLWCYRVDEKRVIVGGALSDGGGLYALLKKNLSVEMSDRAISEEISYRGADAHRLTVLPFFFGERSTGYNENARGYILGLSPSNDAIHILQAAMEAVAFRFAEVLDQLKKVARINEIVLSGGALDASPVWTQIIADVLGRDVVVSKRSEASLLGAVQVGIESACIAKPRHRRSEPGTIVRCNAQRHQDLLEGRSKHDALYASLVTKGI